MPGVIKIPLETQVLISSHGMCGGPFRDDRVLVGELKDEEISGLYPHICPCGDCSEFFLLISCNA